MFRLIRTVAAASLAAAAPIAHAQAAATPVVVIVKVPKPWYAPRALVVGKMRDTVPEYQSLPGLAHKAFSFARPGDEFGGLYLWTSRSAALAWFGPHWFERVQRERGVQGDVRMFDAPVVLVNTPSSPSARGAALASAYPGLGLLGNAPEADAAAAHGVATVVSIPVPAGVTRQDLIDGFNAAVPTYRAVPGLLRKYFTLTDDGRFGGVYLWDREASARRWFDDAWQARVRQTYGAPAVIEWFDTPVLLPSRDPANRIDTALR
jgi:hypothetical protein